MSTDIETRLKAAYLANGGSEAGFDANTSELVKQYRNQATINAALEAETPPTINDLLRQEFQQATSRNDDLLQRMFVNGKQNGSSNDEA